MSAPRAGPSPHRPRPRSPRPAEARRRDARPDDVTGRVLDPAGKPAAGVPVDIIGVPRTPGSGNRRGDDRASSCSARARPTATAASASRQPRTSSARFFDVYALAGAAGPAPPSAA